jgi:hypothetical protein
MRRTAALLLFAAATTGCSEPLEFADWAFPVPEGVRVIEYPATPDAARTERIGLVEDLVLGRFSSAASGTRLSICTHGPTAPSSSPTSR